MVDSTGVVSTVRESKSSASCTCDLPVAQLVFGCPRSPCQYQLFDVRHAIHHQEAYSMRDRFELMGLPLVAPGASVFDGQPLRILDHERSPEYLFEHRPPPPSVTSNAWEPPNFLSEALYVSESSSVYPYPASTASNSGWASLPAPHPQQQFESFPFLRLPSEIRNVIYRQVLVKQRMLRVKAPYDRFLPITGLLCVSKQVHHEASSIFYQENRFLLPEHLFSEESILQSLARTHCLPPHTLMTLKDLEIHITVSISKLRRF